MPAEAPKVHELAVLLDDVEDKVKVKVFKFDEASNSYIFEYRGLIPGTRYEIENRAGRQRAYKHS
jgi:hypothetical protein